MSLQTQAMLVVLSVSGWGARKQDKKVAAEVEASHNAHDAGEYRKRLIDKAHLEPLERFEGQVRKYHYKMTAPWMDNGARILPSKLSMEYFAEIRKLKIEQAALVDTFVRVYETKLVQDARVRLGTMYDPDDYPSGAEIRAKFGIDLDIQPVPDGHDFRVDVGDAERQRIAQDIIDKVAARTATAQRDAWSRVRNAVSTIESRLSVPKARIYDTLISNVEDLARLLPGLNISNDPLMDHVCTQITERLIVDPQRLRDSMTSRKRVADAAREILDMVPHDVEMV